MTIRNCQYTDETNETIAAEKLQGTATGPEWIPVCIPAVAGNADYDYIVANDIPIAPAA